MLNWELFIPLKFKFNPTLYIVASLGNHLYFTKLIGLLLSRKVKSSKQNCSLSHSTSYLIFFDILYVLREPLLYWRAASQTMSSAWVIRATSVQFHRIFSTHSPPFLSSAWCSFWLYGPTLDRYNSVQIRDHLRLLISYFWYLSLKPYSGVNISASDKSSRKSFVKL